MNVRKIVRRLLGRWYILVPGLVLAIALAGATWNFVPSKYERTATKLLLPGDSSVPDNSNPYFYLAGLSQAADVIVRALSSDNVLLDLENRYPNVSMEVQRDPTTAGPVILITVTANSDTEAAAALEMLSARTAEELANLQRADNVAPNDQITTVTVSMDSRSSLKQRTRIIATAGVGAAVALLTVLLTAAVEGLSTNRRRRRHADAAEPESAPNPPPSDSVTNYLTPATEGAARYQPTAEGSPLFVQPTPARVSTPTKPTRTSSISTGNRRRFKESQRLRRRIRRHFPLGNRAKNRALAGGGAVEENT